MSVDSRRGWQTKREVATQCTAAGPGRSRGGSRRALVRHDWMNWPCVRPLQAWPGTTAPNQRRVRDRGLDALSPPLQPTAKLRERAREKERHLGRGAILVRWTSTASPASVALHRAPVQDSSDLPLSVQTTLGFVTLKHRPRGFLPHDFPRPSTIAPPPFLSSQVPLDQPRRRRRTRRHLGGVPFLSATRAQEQERIRTATPPDRLDVDREERAVSKNITLVNQRGPALQYFRIPF